jgi:hypothetical protein
MVLTNPQQTSDIKHIDNLDSSGTELESQDDQDNQDNIDNYIEMDNDSNINIIRSAEKEAVPQYSTVKYSENVVTTEESVSPDQTVINSGTRGDFTESEPNNDFSNADDITSVSKPINIQGSSLSTPSDTDIYEINLDGAEKPVDNLTVELTFLDSSDWGTRYYSTFYISIYGKYDNKYLLMKVVSCALRNWNNQEDCPPATIHAFDTTDYYIKTSATISYPYYNGRIDYTLKISTSKIYPEDDNQVIDTAEELFGPITKKTVRMNTDLFDWYYIDAQDPTNYSTNFSFTIDITKGKSLETENINSQMIYFVTELHVVLYVRTYKGLKYEDEVIGNQFKKYDQDDPIKYYQHFPIQPYENLRFYIGIYVQTYGRNNDGEGEYIWGDGYCDGWAEYHIKLLQTKPMIPPKLSDAKVQSPIGKVYNTFTYFVNYQDQNNDKPKTITLTIDNKPKIYPMSKLDDSDNTYLDGCVYKYSIDGSMFDQSEEVHEFTIFAEDKEVKAEKVKGIGPIITNNILPAARPSGANQYIIFEDDPITYLDLNMTFEDADNDTLFYRLSKDLDEWSNRYNTDNITVSVITITDGFDQKMKYLEFKVKKNQYNRERGQKFGSEIIYINVSDDDPNNPEFPDQNGNLSRAHYIWNPYELEIIIMEVNDPPEIKTPFKYGQDFINGELVINEDQPVLGFDLNTVFWDPIENNPLTYSVRNNKNIDVKFYKNSTGDYMDIFPNENWTGTESLEIFADDGEDWITDTLRVKIKPVNDNPYLNYTPKQVIFESQWFNITFIGYDTADNEDVFFETNLIDVLELSSKDYYFNPETGELQFRPGNKNVGTYRDIWVSVNDRSGGKTTQNVIFEILNTPDKPEPEILSPADGDRYLDTEFIDFRGTYYDPDDEVLLEPHEFSWHSNNDGLLSRSKDYRGQLSAGEHVITLMVSDSQLNGTVSIKLRVVTVSDQDRDNDKIPDYWEILNFLNENNPHDAKEDPDSDTYNNLEEYLGMDGKDAGDDDTDPNDPDEHPSKHFIEPKEEDYTYIYNWIGVIIILIFILLVVFFIIRQSRRTRAGEEEEEFEKPKEKVYWNDMFGRKYEVYAYEPVEIICHNCLEKQDIQIPIRPLVITCKKCKARGVLYK